MAYKIPLFNLNFDEREAQAAYDTIKSGWISTGPKNAELELMFIDMWKVKYAVSMSNCTDALHVCCMVCGFGPGDEVICPSLTFAASCNCIRYVGATPIFADIVGPAHINIDPKDIEAKITPRTKGIVVVHMAGFPADMDAIIEIAQKYDLKVIEDACHGPLSEYSVPLVIAQVFHSSLIKISLLVRVVCSSPITSTWLRRLGLSVLMV